VPVAFLVACKDQPSAPQAAVLQVHAIAADFTNNLNGGGPRMWRSDEAYWADVWSSPDGNVLAVQTTFPLSWIGWDWDDAVCGPPGLGSMHDQFNIRHWDPTSTDLAAEWHLNGIMDAWIVLLGNPPAPGWFPCNSQTIIASGWGRLNQNDNNYYLTGRPQEAFSMKAEGKLTTPAGARVNYNGHLHCVYNPGGNINWDCNSLVNFH
jgi:hypothetical protein